MLLRFAEGYRSVISYVIAHGRIYRFPNTAEPSDRPVIRLLLPILRDKVRDTRAIGSVADDNLGMFGITEMAVKIADAPRQRIGSPELQAG